MRLICFFFCLFISSFSIMAQTQTEETLFRIWDKTGEEGYINSSGKIIIRPQFDGVTEFSENLAAVLIKDKWGYINRAGEIVIQPRWKPNDRYIPAANPFKDGLALVVEYAQWREDGDLYFCGYIDKTGKYVVQPQIRRDCYSIKPKAGAKISDKGAANSPNDLTLEMLKLRTISERPDFRNIYGYKNKQGKYVWLSPDAEKHLDRNWIKENYVGQELR